MLKPGIATKALNELMIRYAQDGQLRNVATCLAKGADVNFNNGQLLLVATYLGKEKIVKLALRSGASLGLQEALEVAEKMGFTKLALDIQEHLNKQDNRE